MQFPSTFANLFLVYFDFAYYLLVSPFRFVKSNQKNSQSHWKIQSNKIQQVGFIILGVLGIFANIVSFRSVLSKSKINERNPDFYFALLSFSFALFSRIAFYKTLYFDRQKFTDIVNLMTTKSATFLTSGTQAIWQSKWTWLLIHTIYMHEVVFKFIHFLGLLDQDSETLGCSLKYRADKTFFYENFTSNSAVECKLFTEDYLLITLYILVWINHYLIEHFLILSLLLASFTLWIASKTFQSNLERSFSTTTYSYKDITPVIFTSAKDNIKHMQIFES